MNSTVNIHLRVPLKEARLLKRAAKLQEKKLATYVRDAAVSRALDDTTTIAENIIAANSIIP